MNRTTPADTQRDKVISLITLLADRPVFDPIVQPGGSQEVVLPNAPQDLTSSLIETSRQLPEKICPKAKNFFAHYCEHCGFIRYSADNCNKRTCPVCMKRHCFKLIAKHMPICSKMQNPKLFTLTLRNTDNLRQGCLDIRAALTRLRHRKPFSLLFKSLIDGVEYKRGKDGKWNIHLHALVDTKYIPQRLLSQRWAQCTGGSGVVDIRKAWSPKGGLKYILKYIMKSDIAEGDEDYVNESLSGLRLVSTAGALYSSSNTTPGYPCPRCGSTNWSPCDETVFTSELFAEMSSRRITHGELDYG